MTRANNRPWPRRGDVGIVIGIDAVMAGLVGFRLAATGGGTMGGGRWEICQRAAFAAFSMAVTSVLTGPFNVASRSSCERRKIKIE